MPVLYKSVIPLQCLNKTSNTVLNLIVLAAYSTSIFGIPKILTKWIFTGAATETSGTQ